MNKPLTCIFTALFSILIVGYVNSADIISNEFLMVLYIVASIFYIFALYKLIRNIKIKFYPSFAAFTFPFVISALATKGVLGTLKIGLLNYVLVLQTVIVTVLVVYVLIKYIQFLKK